MDVISDSSPISGFVVGSKHVQVGQVACSYPLDIRHQVVRDIVWTLANQA